MRDLHAWRAAEPALPEAELRHRLAESTSVPERLIGVAVDYWRDYPAEVDAFLVRARAAEREVESA